MLAWNRMAIIGLDFVLRARHVLDEFLDTIYALAWIAVPCQRRCGTIELWQIVRSGGRVVGGVVQTGELIGGPRGYIYAKRRISRDFDGLA